MRISTQVKRLVISYFMYILSTLSTSDETRRKGVNVLQYNCSYYTSRILFFCGLVAHWCVAYPLAGVAD